LKELKEVALVFLKLGFITFGGPAAHIALFEEEIISKRKWMNREHFIDLVGATNLIPGPNSTEMAIHCGYHRAGIPGLITAGLSFTFPAVLITGIFAYIYVAYGSLPEVKPFLYGIKPAVIIIILSAVYKLGSKAVKGLKLTFIAAAVVIINFLGVNEIFSILAGGIFGSLFIYFSDPPVGKAGKQNNLFSLSIFSLLSLFSIAPLMQAVEKSETSLITLFLACLKIGTVWFGSGYVLVAYFDGEFVQGLQWLTRQELLDAIAVGQFTPGPFLSSATFIGYQIAGISGALLATIGIMIPSFIFVLILNPVIPRLRNSKFLSKFLDAVNVSALAVMLVVGVKLGVEILIDWRTIFIALLSAATFLIIRKINSAYIILGGAVLGYLLN
jgi:chromate transporter